MGRTVVLQVRVDQAEKAMYERSARAEGLSLSAWVRATLTQVSGPGGVLPRPSRPAPVAAEPTQADRLATARAALAGAKSEEKLPSKVLQEIRATRDANPEMPHDEIARRFVARYPGHEGAIAKALEVEGWA